MKNFLNKSLITIKTKTYLGMLIILVPLLNFLSGINVDLYTPSLPALMQYYATSMTAVKNTISAELIGFAIGCFFSGILLDSLGRRRVILSALFLYIIVSLLAIVCHTIDQLIAMRFIQGLLVSAVSIGCRAIVVDSFTGHRFTIAMLYTSLAYGLGPIIGPFVGGILQYHFGWKANFMAYAVVGLMLSLLFALYVNESLPNRQPFSIKQIALNYLALLKHPIFIEAMFLVGLGQFQLMLYPTLGTFLVEDVLHHTAIVYGNTALLVGAFYLLGTLTNRFLIKRIELHRITFVGLSCLAVGLVIQLCFACFGSLSLFTLIFPMMIVCYSQGIVFPSLLARSAKLFPKYAGITISALICMAIALSSAGVFILSHIDVRTLTQFSMIVAITIVLQLVLFFGFFKKEQV